MGAPCAPTACLRQRIRHWRACSSPPPAGHAASLPQPTDGWGFGHLDFGGFFSFGHLVMDEGANEAVEGGGDIA